MNNQENKKITMGDANYYIYTNVGVFIAISKKPNIIRRAFLRLAFGFKVIDKEKWKTIVFGTNAEKTE